MIIKKLMAATMAITAMFAFAEPVVSDVVAKQRYPWNGLVDITCKVSGMEEATKLQEFVVAAVVPDTGEVRLVSHFWVMRDGVKSTDYKVSSNGNYKLLWDAKAYLGEVAYSNMIVRVTTQAVRDKVQLWENGPYWGTTNIGAEEPEDYGYYFWCGDTVGYKRENDKWIASDGSSSDFSFDPGNTPTWGKRDDTLQSEGWITADGVLAPEHDAAHIHWGGNWRMPTDQELDDLNSKCDWAWTTINGVNGYIVRGRGDYADNSIFLPCAGYGVWASLYNAGSYGYYWSSVLDGDFPEFAWYLEFFYSGVNYSRYDENRCLGGSVRPVQGFTGQGNPTYTEDDSSGDSAPFVPDTVTGSAPGLRDAVSISYDAAWIGGDAGATVVIEDNGVEIARKTGAGEFEYQLTGPCKHTLTYKTLINDVEQEDTYTVTVFKGWAYEVDDNDGAILVDTAYKSGDVVIPSEIDGHTVIGIGERAFEGCEALTSVTIPDSVTSIWDWAFYGCSGLTSVTIGNSVTSIGNSAFSGCDNVREATLPGWNCGIPFGNVTNLVISMGTTSIGNSAFSGCSGLTSVTIPDSVTSIGVGAFAGCSYLLYDGTTIPGVKMVDGWAVGYEESLTGDLDLTGVRGVANGAFARCSGLTSVIIPCDIDDSRIVVASEVPFYRIGSITNIVFKYGVTSIGYIFDGYFDGYSYPTGGDNVITVMIPNSVTNIKRDAFYFLPGDIESITIPPSVTNIDDSAFPSGLETVYLPIGHEFLASAFSLSTTRVYYKPLPIVYFDANGGAVSPESDIKTYGEPYGELPVPSRDHYMFIGWIYDGNAILPDTTVSAMDDHTLVAQWELKRHLVTFDANGGVGGWSEVRDCDQELVAPEVSRMGYNFIGWLPDVSATVPDEDVTYVAQWEIGQYTATFNANGGAGGRSLIQDYGTAISAPTVTRTGYTFSGWSPEVPDTMPGEDVTYTAQWTPKKYTITFNANGGDGGWSQLLDYGTDIVAPIVTRIGYDFKGWKPSVAATVPNASVTYMAQWELRKHLVTFDANGGDGGWSAVRDYCSPLVAPVVERPHHTFVGWLPDVPATVPDEDVVYVAQWRLNSHTVTFNANGGAGGWSRVMSYGAEIVAPEVTRTGYTFKGWSPDVAATVPDADVAYVAQWEANKHSITFDANGGEGGWSTVMDYGSAIVAPEVTRTGYDFTGWQPEVSETVPDADVVYVAQWTIRRLTVTFDANGGAGGWSRVMDYGTAISAPDVTRVGYTFRSWHPEVAATVPDANVTYVAQWTPDKYLVSFDANGGEGGWSEMMEYDSCITAPEVTREGHDFAGWMPEVAETVPNADVVYVAQWTIRRHNVSFDANGGTGGWSEEMDYGAAIVPPVVTRTGYIFNCWSPEVAATVPDEDVAYAAQWTPEKYLVTFDANGGIGGWSEIMDYDSAITVPAVTRTGYSFTGWTPEVSDTVPNADVVYVAQWTPRQYRITFDANGGIGGWSELMDYDSAVVAPTVTRTGYTFKGWSSEVSETVPNTDVIYVAQWEINMYSVTFDANGGEGGWSEIMVYDAVITAPEVTRFGYDFAGWSPEVSETVPNADVVYVAQWTIRRHNVSFDANGGIGGWSEEMDYGTAILPPVVTRTGYIFNCWSPEVLATVPDEDVAYVAQWTPEKYLVTFDANGGIGGWSEIMDYDSAITVPAVTRTGYSFMGWTPEVSDTVPNADVVYVAQWTPRKYRITFDANGGTGGWSELMDYDSAVVAPTVTRTGYTFKGWSSEVAETVPNTDVIYVALWEINTYSVMFDANGGEGGWSEMMVYDAVITAPEVTRLGYDFAGWSPEVSETVPNADVVYVAQWAIHRHMVAFDANGGAGGWSREMDYGAEIVAPTVFRAGHTFMGWSEDVLPAVPDEDVMYVAQWEINRYSITFDANGGTGGWSEIMDYGSGIIAPLVTRTGHDFAGWSPAVSQTVPDADVVYVAQWTPRKYHVIFDANGGIGGWSELREFGSALVAPTVTRTGYDFSEWSPEVLPSVPAGDVTYVAQWTPKKYLVTFDANGGEGGWSEERDYDSAIVAPVVTRKGYEFVGWSPDVSKTVPNANVTYFAQWTPKKYRITFDANGGEGGWSEMLEYGSAIEAPTVTRTGYSFVEWSPEVAATVPHADVIYTARWEVSRHKVTFDANGGTGGWSETLDYGTAIVAPEVSRTGYSFTGWLPEVAAAVLDEDVTYVAQWTVNRHVVAFDANGGEGGWIRTMDYGAAIVAPDVVRSGYEFTGWLPEVAATVPDEDVSYTAQWEPKRYRVVFDANGGDGAMEDETLTVNVPQALSDNRFSRQGYVFLGWSGSANGKVAEYLDGEVVENLSDGDVAEVSLFAVWARNTTNVSLGSVGDAPWRLERFMREDGAVWRSGEIGDGESSSVECAVFGAGEVRFWWKVSCEDTIRDVPYDYVSFHVDGAAKEWIAGETAWTNVVVNIDGDGQHVLKWVYQKDDWVDTKAGEDCGWIAEVVWTPSSVIPAVAADADAEVVDATVDGVGFADENVKEAIGGSAEVYADFKAWAEGVEGGAAAVVASEHAAAAYLLGAAVLFSNEPVIEISEVEVGSEIDQMTNEQKGTVTLSVTVWDGDNAVAVASEKIMNMFEATSNLGDWDGEAKLTPTVEALPGDGATLRFKVKPGDGTSASAFLRIRR